MPRWRLRRSRVCAPSRTAAPLHVPVRIAPSPVNPVADGSVLRTARGPLQSSADSAPWRSGARALGEVTREQCALLSACCGERREQRFLRNQIPATLGATLPSDCRPMTPPPYGPMTPTPSIKIRHGSFRISCSPGRPSEHARRCRRGRPILGPRRRSMSALRPSLGKIERLELVSATSGQMRPHSKRVRPNAKSIDLGVAWTKARARSMVGSGRPLGSWLVSAKLGAPLENTSWWVRPLVSTILGGRRNGACRCRPKSGLRPLDSGRSGRVPRDAGEAVQL